MDEHCCSNHVELYEPIHIVEKQWSVNDTEFCNNNEVNFLVLNNWAGKKLNFLKEIPQLQALQVSSDGIGPPVNISGLESQTNLQYLNLCCDIRGDIKLSIMPLDLCSIPWWTGAEAILNCTSINHLSIRYYPTENLELLSNLLNLKILSIEESSFSNFSGLDKLQNLEMISLYDLPKLSSLRKLKAAHCLKSILICDCTKIDSLNDLRDFSQLEYIEYSNEVLPSLKPVAMLPNLKKIGLYGVDNLVDGDVGCTLKNPSIEDIWFSHRSHYSHTIKEWMEARYPDEDFSCMDDDYIFEYYT